MMSRHERLFELTGRTAWVVGAARSMPRPAASGLAVFGAHVICADVRGDGGNAGLTRPRQGRCPGFDAEHQCAQAVVGNER